MVIAKLMVEGKEVEEIYNNWTDFNNNSIFLARKYDSYTVIEVKERK